ncbi:MFS transporter [Streptomyces sp. TP-A0874]|uniref:MFS transporter n=1 Tax=Streptomyces sp. TP-A0874 TaxID=549819 RepID=UPI001112EF28|nr:MFS transporter [Streptomyces sp. TP-A0874]
MTDPSDAALPAGRRALAPLGILLTAVMMVASTAQFGLGALAPAIRADLSLSNSQFGLLNSVFFLSVAFFSVILPKALAQIREHTAFVSVSVLMVAGMGIVAVAVNSLYVVPGLMLAAVATAAANPITNRAVLATGQAREPLIAIKQSGVALATIVCGAVLPSLATLTDWRVAVFSYTVSVGSVPLLLLRWTGTRKTKPPPARPSGSTGRYSILQVVVYALLMGTGGAAVSTYLAFYIHTELAVDVVMAGLVFSCVGVGAIAGRFLWGPLAIRAIRRGGHLQHQLLVMALIATVATAGLIASVWGGVPLAAVCAWLLGMSASSWNPLGMMIAAASGDPALTMRTSGLIMLGFFTGLGLGPPGYGLLADRYGHTVGWSATLVVFACAGAMMSRRTDKQHPPAV